MEKDQEIKEALYEIYCILKDVASTASGKRLLSSQIAEQLIYGKNEVKQALTAEMSTKGKQTTTKEAVKKQSTKQTTSKVSERLRQITDSTGVRQIYEKELAQWFDPKLSQKGKDQLLRSFTAADLGYLYSLISSVGVKSTTKKVDLMKMFKSYYDDERRTADLNRKLMGK
ncbi:MAG: hypothetical protein ACRCW2_13750 [Cellulosilyticaceae bacterium]